MTFLDLWLFARMTFASEKIVEGVEHYPEINQFQERKEKTKVQVTTIS